MGKKYGRFIGLVTIISMTLSQFVMFPVSAQNVTDDCCPHDTVSEEFSVHSESQTTNIDFSKNEVVISGHVTHGNEVIPYSKKFDLVENDPVVLMDSLFAMGVISETQKIEQYCDMYETRPFAEGYCLVPLMSDLQEYYERKSTVRETLTKTEIEVMDRVGDILALAYNPPSLPENCNSVFFDGHFDESVVDRSEVQRALNHLDNMYRVAVNNGFEEPLCETGKNRIQVYFLSRSGGAGGNAFQDEEFQWRSAAAIEIYNFSTLDPYMKETLAHELFHAVEYAYQNNYSNNKWIFEACAVWFSVKYSGEMDAVTDDCSDYLSSPNQPINTSTGSSLYMAAPYIMTIDVEYGGTPTIERMWYNYSLVGNSFSETVVQNGITSAIRYAGYTSSSFTEAFKTSGAHITYPKYFYSTILPSGSDWDNPIGDTEIATTWESQQSTLTYLGAKLVRFVPRDTTTNKNIQITLTFTGGSNNAYRIVTKKSNGTYSVIAGNGSTTKTVQGFGISIEEVFVVALNAATSGTTNVRISAVVS